MKFRVFPSQLAEQPRKRKKAREASLSLCAEAEKAPVFFLFPKKVEAENASHHSLTQNFFFKFFQESFCGWSVLCRSQRTVCAVLQRRRERERERRKLLRAFRTNFTGARFPPHKKKRRHARARSHYFLAEEISKVSIVVREVAREIRGGLCPLFYLPRIARREREREGKGTLFSVT
jgi:hypothetical protein